MMSDDVITLRRDAVNALHAKAFNHSLALFNAVLERVPDDAVSLYHLGLLLQAQNQQDQAAAMLRAAVASDPSYAIGKGVGTYLARRLHVREGAAFEDGWLTMLELALASKVLPQNTLDGLSALQPNADPANGIPFKLMQYWDKPEPPEEVRNLIERSKTANVEYSHMLFNDDTAQDYLATSYGKDFLDAYRQCFHVSMKADFFRLAYLYKTGGFYMDADEVCDRSLAPVFQVGGLKEVYTFSRGVPNCINNWFIGTVPGSRIIEATLEHCLQNIDSMVRFGRQSNVWVLTGPGVLTFSILDIFSQPEEYAAGNPFKDTVFLEESEYRKIFDAPPMQYKESEQANWRLV